MTCLVLTPNPMICHPLRDLGWAVPAHSMNERADLLCTFPFLLPIELVPRILLPNFYLDASAHREFHLIGIHSDPNPPTHLLSSNPPMHSPPTDPQNKQLPAKPLRQPGALLLGDAFNMRHPLTGGGMTVALSDCKLLCDMLQPLSAFSDPIETSKTTADFYTRRKPLSATINTLANALYKVFCFTGGWYNHVTCAVQEQYTLAT